MKRLDGIFMSVPAATYVNSKGNIRTKAVKNTRTKFFVSFFAAILIMLSAFSMFFKISPTSSSHSVVTTNNTASANAFAFRWFCSDNSSLGHNMDQSTTSGGAPSTDVVEADKKGRQWTAQELLGNGVRLVGYQGEGNDFKWAQNISEDRATKNGVPDSMMGDLKQQRGFYKCVPGTFGLYIANGIEDVTKFVTYATTFVVTEAFNADFICKDANSTGNCFNILKIVGGTGDSHGGLIGALTSGIYMPLILILASIAGFRAGWLGLKEHKVREGLTALLWLCVAVFLGVIFLLSPSLIAKFPVTVANAGAECVIGAFNGDNCFNDTNTGTTVANGDTTSNLVCKSSADGLNADEQMSMTMNSLGCSIWKAFVLEPYSQAQFGHTFEELDMKDSNNAYLTKNATTGGVKDPTNAFCVEMASTESASDFNDNNNSKNYISTDSTSKTVCNLALYQTYLGSAVSSNGDTVPPQGTLDGRWYKIIQTVHSDPQMWNRWTVSAGSTNAKLGIMFTALLSSVATAPLLMVTAIATIMFMMIVSVLMAFAPFFLLAAVDYGRGRRLFLGWLETILENVFKYVASALFLVIVVALFGAILGASSSMFTLFIVLVLNSALWRYRSEFLGLMGKTNLGGQKMSNAVSQSFKKNSQTLNRYRRSAVGSAIGSVLSSDYSQEGRAARRKIREDNKETREATIQNGNYNAFRAGASRAAGFAGDRFATSPVLRGAGTGLRRAARSGTSVVAGGMREFERLSTDNKNDIRSEGTRVKGEAEKLENRLSARSGLKDQVAEKHDDIAKQQQAINEYEENQIAKVNKDAELAKNAELNVLQKIEVISPDFAKAQALMSQSRNLQVTANIQEKMGDTAMAREMRNEAVQNERTAKQIFGNIDQDKYDHMERYYENSVHNELYGKTVSGETNVGNIMKNYEDSYMELANMAEAKDKTIQDFDNKRKEVIDVQKEANVKFAEAEVLTKQAIAFSPDDTVTVRQKKDILKTAKEKAQESTDERFNQIEADREFERTDLTSVAPKPIKLDPVASIQRSNDRSDNDPVITDQGLPQIPTKIGTSIYDKQRNQTVAKRQQQSGGDKEKEDDDTERDNTDKNKENNDRYRDRRKQEEQERRRRQGQEEQERRRRRRGPWGDGNPDSDNEEVDDPDNESEVF